MTTMRTIRPLRNQLLVAPEPSVRQSSGGIVFPDTSLDENNIGGPKLYRVVAVGPGKRTRKGLVIPSEVNVGDRVVCHNLVSNPVHLEDGTRRRFVDAKDVLMVLPAANSEG